jgi:hypothetical protein
MLKEYRKQSVNHEDSDKVILDYILMIFVYIYTVKPVLRSHHLGKRKCGLIRQVTVS